jgi:hypothetical protein
MDYEKIDVYDITACFSGRRPRVRRSVLYVVSVDSLWLKTTMV